MSTATAVNTLGQVVGSSVGPLDCSSRVGGCITRVFLWQAGTLAVVRTDSTPTLPGIAFLTPNPLPYAINQSGRIVGDEQIFNYDVTTVPVVWDSQSSGARRLSAPLWLENGVASAINDAGQIIGSALACADSATCEALPKRIHAFFWSSEQDPGVDVGTLGGVGSAPTGGSFAVETSLVALNQAGQAVGWSLAPTGAAHAVLWSAGTLHDLGTLGGPTSAAYSIDETGAVFGTSDTANGQIDVFLWAPGGLIDRGALPAGSSGVAINRLGDAIGQVPTGGYFWRAGMTTELAMTVNALNDFGEVAGVGDTNHLVVWRNGVTTDLGNLGGSSIAPVAIDNAGHIIGSGTTTAGAQHAFLFQPADCPN